MNPNTIREFAASFQKSRILLSGFELDISLNIDYRDFILIREHIIINI